ncbi:hypothetical protein [Nostoc sp. CALU 546]
MQKVTKKWVDIATHESTLWLIPQTVRSHPNGFQLRLHNQATLALTR